MDSRVPVRHLSKTVCLVALLLAAIGAVPFGAAEAGAQIDAPGWVYLHFLADPDTIYQTFEQVPEDIPLSSSHARAYFSSDASSFEDTGVRIWAGFDLDDGRHAMLIIDLDLQEPMRSEATVLKEDAVRVEYLETRDDRILFEGHPLAVNVRVWEVWLDGGDSGGLEGEFDCILMDPADAEQGSRVLLNNRFFTNVRTHPGWNAPDVDQQGETYVETGCGSDVYVEDDYEDTGCGGDDYDDDYDYGGSSDCEGDTYDSGSDSGCGGDTYDSGSDSGCESDTYDSGYSDSSSCEGDTYDSYDSSDDGPDCEGDEAYAAVLKPAPRRRRRPNPLRAVMRMLPEIVGISFIVYMKRRHRSTG